jgi:hypothetical protein
MSNRICLTGKRGEDTVVLGEVTSSVPVLWIALFRSGDLLEEDEAERGIPLPEVDLSLACEQLEAALPILEHAFEAEGGVRECATQLLGALRDSGCESLTLDWTEAAWLMEEGELIDEAESVWEVLEGGEDDLEVEASSRPGRNPFTGEPLVIHRPAHHGIRGSLLRLSGLEAGIKVPTLEKLRSGQRLSKMAIGNRYSMVGLDP